MKQCDVCKKEVRKLYEVPKFLKYYGVNDLCKDCNNDFCDEIDRVFIKTKRIGDGLFKAYVKNKIK